MSLERLSIEVTTGCAEDPDFPAAHSMDTDWFAVDRDGHVAMFTSDEPGAVPIDAACYPGLKGRPPDQHPWVDDWYRLIEDIQREVGPREIVVEPTGFGRSTGPEHVTEWVSVRSGRQQRIAGIVMFLAPCDVDTSAIPTHDAEVIVHESPTGPAVVVRGIWRRSPGERAAMLKLHLRNGIDSLLRALRLELDLGPVVIRIPRGPQQGIEVPYLLDLHRRGACLRCGSAGMVLEDDGSTGPHRSPNPARAGVYFYQHLGAAHGGPYGLWLRPRRPIRLDELPARFRPAIEGVAFDLSFEHTPTLTPERHVRCVSFGHDEAETRREPDDSPGRDSDRDG